MMEQAEEEKKKGKGKASTEEAKENGANEEGKKGKASKRPKLSDEGGGIQASSHQIEILKKEIDAANERAQAANSRNAELEQSDIINNELILYHNNYNQRKQWMKWERQRRISIKKTND